MKVLKRDDPNLRICITLLTLLFVYVCISLTNGFLIIFF